jgi:tetratricopeptide (TPR) repeat protein
MESIKEILQIGKHHFDNKRYAQAEQYLRRVVDEHPRYADVFNMLGVISHIDGKFASAVESFEKALEINPHYTEAMLNLAVLYNDLGQYDKAKDLYARLKDHKPAGTCRIEPVLRGKLSNLHADIGDIYRSIGLFDHAIGEYKKALALNPHYLDIRTKLGQALRENGRTHDSLAEFKQVLKEKTTYAPALIQLGVTYYTLDKANDAKNAWRKALECEPENEYAKMYLRLCEAIAKSSGETAVKKESNKRAAANPERKRATKAPKKISRAAKKSSGQNRTRSK